MVVKYTEKEIIEALPLRRKGTKEHKDMALLSVLAPLR